MQAIKYEVGVVKSTLLQYVILTNTLLFKLVCLLDNFLMVMMMGSGDFNHDHTHQQPGNICIHYTTVFPW